jgi:hypothetical protein
MLFGSVMDIDGRRLILCKYIVIQIVKEGINEVVNIVKQQNIV